jgi:hypothetical protein
MLKLSARDLSQLTQTSIGRDVFKLDIQSEVQSIQYRETIQLKDF